MVSECQQQSRSVYKHSFSHYKMYSENPIQKTPHFTPIHYFNRSLKVSGEKSPYMYELPSLGVVNRLHKLPSTFPARPPFYPLTFCGLMTQWIRNEECLSGAYSWIQGELIKHRACSMNCTHVAHVVHCVWITTETMWTWIVSSWVRWERGKCIPKWQLGATILCLMQIWHSSSRGHHLVRSLASIFSRHTRIEQTGAN